MFFDSIKLVYPVSHSDGRCGTRQHKLEVKEFVVKCEHKMENLLWLQFSVPRDSLT